MAKKICNIRDHDWRPTKSDYELCTKCGTRFPCRSKDCGHLDCMAARGQEIPEYWRQLLEALGIAVDAPTLPAKESEEE